jgi:hypothetical protein
VAEPPESYRELLARDFEAPPGEPPVYATYRRNWGLYEPETMRRYIACNLLQIEILDRAVGVFLAALRESPLFRDSLLAFVADHGEMNGEKALIDKGVYAHPKVARVPLALKLPGNEMAGRRVGEPVCLLDLAPTILEAAGVRVQERLDGQSLLPLARGASSSGTSPFVFEAGWHVTANPAVALVDCVEGTPFLYCFNLTTPHDELYRLDGMDHQNLAGAENYAAAKRSMMRSLGEVLGADDRWRCYRDAFRLAAWDVLDSEGGDAQMFVPE